MSVAPLTDNVAVPLREHIELMMEARDRTLEVQIRALAQVVRDATEQGSHEHAQVRADLQGIRAEVAAARTDHAALSLKVEQQASSESAAQRLRAADMVKIGILSGVVGTVVVVLQAIPH